MLSTQDPSKMILIAVVREALRVTRNYIQLMVQSRSKSYVTCHWSLGSIIKSLAARIPLRSNRMKSRTEISNANPWVSAPSGLFQLPTQTTPWLTFKTIATDRDRSWKTPRWRNSLTSNICRLESNNIAWQRRRDHVSSSAWSQRRVAMAAPS